MNWYRAKTILIVFFVCMNVFLLVNLIYSTNKASVVTPEIINSTIEILKKNDIEIPPELIPVKTVSMPSVEMKNVFANKDIFAETFCGNDVTEKENDTYAGSGGTVRFEGDKFTFMPVSMKNRTDGSDVRECTEMLLADFGINVSFAECIEHSENGNIVLKFKNSINKYKIFDSYINVQINQSGDVLCIDGVWFGEQSNSGRNIPLKSVTGVLIDFILQPQRPTGKNVIEKLELGYTASDADVYHETTVLIPVWQITLSDGKVYCIDTRE